MNKVCKLPAQRLDRMVELLKSSRQVAENRRLDIIQLQISVDTLRELREFDRATIKAKNDGLDVALDQTLSFTARTFIEKARRAF